jgi:hypothetical protein
MASSGISPEALLAIRASMRERLRPLSEADREAIKLSERSNDPLVKLAERVTGLGPRSRDKAIASFAADHRDAVPLYGYDAQEADELGGREIYDAYKRIMRAEQMDPRRQGDREYAKGLALKSCGITLATASTLGQAMRLAESDEPVLLDEEKQPRSARAARRVLRERPDLVHSGYTRQGTEGDHLVRAAERDATAQAEIDDICSQLEDEPPTSPRRRKLEARLAKLMKPGDYGRGRGE